MAEPPDDAEAGDRAALRDADVESPIGPIDGPRVVDLTVPPAHPPTGSVFGAVAAAAARAAPLLLEEGFLLLLAPPGWEPPAADLVVVAARAGCALHPVRVSGARAGDAADLLRRAWGADFAAGFLRAAAS